MADALTECAANADSDNKLSLREISKLHGVPLNTLHRHLKGITKSSNIGRKPLLGIDIEDRIAENILAWHDRGLSLRISQLKLFTFHVAQKLQPDAPLVKAWAKTGVTAKWVRGFLKRHPVISIRIADNLDHHRRNVTAEHIKDFYKLLEKVQHFHPQRSTCLVFADTI